MAAGISGLPDCHTYSTYAHVLVLCCVNAKIIPKAHSVLPDGFSRSLQIEITEARSIIQMRFRSWFTLQAIQRAQLLSYSKFRVSKVTTSLELAIAQLYLCEPLQLNTYSSNTRIQYSTWSHLSFANIFFKICLSYFWRNTSPQIMVKSIHNHEQLQREDQSKNWKVASHPSFGQLIEDVHLSYWLNRIKAFSLSFNLFPTLFHFISFHFHLLYVLLLSTDASLKLSLVDFCLVV